MPRTDPVKEWQKAGRERLYPSIANPNWLVLRKRRELFRSWLKETVPEGAAVLDVGGRIQPYRPLLPGGVRYWAIDLRSAPMVNVVANAERIPFRSQTFDLVLCTQMLEYATDPLLVLSEIHRVLKPGGRLLLSVPAVFPRDSDEDRWRFLPAAIRQLLAAFSDVEIAPEGGSIAGVFRTTNVCLQLFAKYGVIRTALGWTVIPVLNLLGLGVEEIVRSRNDAFVVNYSAMARK
jgi:SAM-dependent methyltransferase